MTLITIEFVTVAALIIILWIVGRLITDHAHLQSHLDGTHLAVLAGLMTLSIFLSRAWLLQYPGVILMEALDENKKPEVAVHTVLITVTPDEYTSVLTQHLR